MKIVHRAAVVVYLSAFSVFAQPFTNLDFESANLSPIPAGQYGGSVPIANGLPGWSGMLGANPVTQVLQNDYTLGAPCISILGPDWTTQGSYTVIDGNYSVSLVPGLIEAGPQSQQVSATIYQTGVIPSGDNTLFFDAVGDILADLRGYLTVSFNGQNLPVSTFSIEPDYTEYAVNISALAGLKGDLAFSEIPTAPQYYPIATLDDITFSPEVAPEPAIWALLLCGAGLLGIARRHKNNLRFGRGVRR